MTTKTHHHKLPILPFLGIPLHVVSLPNPGMKKQNEPKYAIFNRKFIPKGTNLENRKLQNEPKTWHSRPRLWSFTPARRDVHILAPSKNKTKPILLCGLGASVARKNKTNPISCVFNSKTRITKKTNPIRAQNEPKLFILICVICTTILQFFVFSARSFLCQSVTYFNKVCYDYFKIRENLCLRYLRKPVP